MNYASVLLVCIFLWDGRTAVVAMKGFGPYFVTTKTMGLCPINKLKTYDTENACSSTVHVVKVSRTKEELRGSIYVPKDIINTHVKLVMQQWVDGGYSPFVNQSITKPCSNVLFGYILKKFAKASPNCLIPNGSFSIQDLDADELLHMFAGNNFFHGRLSFTLEWFSQQGSTCCIMAECESKSIVKSKPRKAKPGKSRKP